MKNLPEYVQRWREAHHKALETLRGSGCKKNGLQLWRALNRLEHGANRNAVALCNGEIEQERYEEMKEWVEARIADLFDGLPQGFFVNGDPRGYALKIDPNKTTIPEGMHKDWGGYGCLAAIIE